MISSRQKLLALATLACAALIPAEACAYTGPGAGISALGSLLALLAAVVFTIVGFVWYPVKRLIRSFKKTSTPAVNDSAAK